MTSVEGLLEKKFIYPGDPDYGLVPLMAVWNYKCHKCGVYAVAKSRIGVTSRLNAHLRQCQGLRNETT